MKIINIKLLLLTIIFANLLAFDPPVYLKNISTNRFINNPNLLGPSLGFSGAVTGTGKFIFISDQDNSVGAELYVMDISTGVISFLKDINTGTSSSFADYFKPFGNDKVIFQAYSQSTGTELWVSDGTLLGTVPVEFVPGVGSALIGTILTTVNSGTPYAIISASTAASGYELYKYDGTTLSLLPEVNPGATSSNPADMMIDSSGVVLFSAITAASGREPYKMNFLTNTLLSLGDINPGVASSNPKNFFYFSFYTESYFSANNGTSGIEPYVSDLLGIPTQLSDLAAGSQGSNPGCFAADPSSNIVFFASPTSSSAGLYSYNGSVSPLVAPGTFYYPINNSCARYSGASSASRKMMFRAFSSANGYEYWVTDGTTTNVLKDIKASTPSSDPIYIANVGTGAAEKILFSANDGSTGVELWSTDGTTIGTTLVNDQIPGIESSVPQLLGIGVDNLVLIGATSINPFSDSYVKTNGTSAGTQVFGSAINNLYKISDYPASLDLFVESIGNNVIFPFRTTNFGQELFVTDGTATGSNVLKDIQVGTSDGFYVSTALPIIKLGNSILFSGLNTENDQELWKTDGTTLGTQLVSDINLGANGSFPTFFGKIGNTAYFAASTSDSGQQLYRTDGSTGGTSIVTTSKPIDFVSYNTPGITTTDKIFYVCTTPATGAELCVSDGTDSGSTVVKDVIPGASGAIISKFNSLGSKALILMDDLVSGSELWISDGTSAGTFVLSDINTGAAGQDLNEFKGITIGNLFFFTARNSENGLELWRTDGTTIGTFRITDLVSGASNLNFLELVEHKGKLFFTTVDPITSEYRIYKSDGTISGTINFGDIEPGNIFSAPEKLTSLGGYLFMSAYHTVYGSEIAYTTGETPGEFTFIDLYSGGESSITRNLMAANGTLYFQAKNPSNNLYNLTKIVVDKCVADDSKIEPGICGCGVADTDSDGDGVANCNETCSSDPLKTSAGICGCGIADTDSNSNAQADCLDNSILDLKPSAPVVIYNKKKKDLTFRVANNPGFTYFYTISQMNSKGNKVLGKKTFTLTANTGKKKLTELLIKRKKLKGKIQITYQLRVGGRLGKVSAIRKLTI